MMGPLNMTARGITREDIAAALVTLRDRPRTVHRHVVHPRSEGWTICADCFQPLFIVRESLG